MKRSRLLWTSAAVLLLLAIGFVALLLNNDSGSLPLTYKSTEVRRGLFERTVSSTGTLAAVETITVGTEVSGTIDRIMVDFNDQVKKGQVLATLKPDLFAAAVAESQASLLRAEADLSQFERELERNRPLYDKGFLTEQEFLPLRYNVDRGRATVASAQASLSRSQTNQRNATIRSPIDGTVIQRSIDAGQTVAASLNTPELFVIARDLSRMQIEADVDETDIGQILPEQAVRFSVQSYPDRSFNGIVRQVRLQPQTIQNVVTYTVIVEAENSDGVLLPGMTATVDFVVNHLEGALLLPTAALRFTPAGKTSEAPVKKADKVKKSTVDQNRTVYLLQPDGSLKPLPVTLVDSDGQLAAIDGEGVREGLSVVTGIDQTATDAKKSFSLFGAMRGKRK